MTRNERIFLFAQTVLLSWLLGLTCMSCLVSGFRISEAELGMLILVCGITALFCGLCYSTKRLGFLPLLLLAAGIFYLWKTDLFLQGLESLANRLSRVYNAAYGWQILQWSQRTQELLDEMLPAGIYILGGGITFLTAWVVARGHSSILPLIPACLPVMSCFVVTDTTPQLVWLLLFLSIAVLLMITSTTRQENTVHGAYLTAMLLVPVIAAVTALLYFIPQVGYDRQPQAQALADRLFRETALQEAWEDVTGQSSVVGSSVDGGKVDLTRIGYRQVSRSEVMRINTHYTGTMYLRGRALDGYTGTQWYDTETDPGLSWPKESALTSIGEVVISTRYAHRMMYLPYYVTSIDLDSVARGLENTKKLAMYSFSCSAPVGKEQYTRLYPTGDTSPDRYTNGLDYTAVLTELPEETAAWAVPLVQQIAGEYQSPYHKAQAIAAYVRSSAKYDLKTRKMSAGRKDFAQWFLESSEKGYCVHFATAATVLLKAAGIPARYVTGYLVEVTEGKTTVVRAENAHAWTEYWLPGFGWTMLEVTPPEEPEEPTQQTTPEQSPSTPENTQPENTLPVQTDPVLPQIPVQTPPKTENTWLPALLWSALGLLAVGLLMFQWKLRVLLRQRRQSRGDNNRRALAYWQEAVLLSRHLGKEPDSALYALAEKARFSQHSLTQEELERFEQELDGARQQLRSRNLFRRLYDTLVLALY